MRRDCRRQEAEQRPLDGTERKIRDVEDTRRTSAAGDAYAAIERPPRLDVIVSRNELSAAEVSWPERHGVDEATVDPGK